MVRRRPHPVILEGVPSGPNPSPEKRYTRAAVLRLPNQERNAKASIQGPIESARHGTGRWVSRAILSASPRSSIQLLIRKDNPVNGQTTEKSDR